MSFISSDWGPYKKRTECRKRYHRHTQTEGGHVKTKAETEVLLLQAKECQQPPAAGRGKEQTRLPSALKRVV